MVGWMSANRWLDQWSRWVESGKAATQRIRKIKVEVWRINQVMETAII